MNRYTLALATVAIVGILVWVLPVWACPSCGFGGNATCVVTNPGKGALSLKGSAALVITSGINQQWFSTGGINDVDFKIRLERSGTQKFYELHLFTSMALPNEDMACLVFEPGFSGDPAVQAAVGAMVNKIFTDFGFPADSRIVITPTSIIEFDSKLVPGTVVCNISGLIAGVNCPGNEVIVDAHIAGMTNLTAYVIRQ